MAAVLCGCGSRSGAGVRIEGGDAAEFRMWDETRKWDDMPKGEAGLEEFWEIYDISREAPFYEYADQAGRPALYLWYDEKQELGCGLWLGYDGDRVSDIQGFAFQGCREETWEERDIFSVKTEEGRDGSGEVKDYQENTVYTRDGRPLNYTSTGILDFFAENNERERVVEVEFFYREDGTLQKKHGYYNPWVFGTWGCDRTEYFDGKERVLFSAEYITHGSWEKYYIYCGEEGAPEYLLELDQNLGCSLPRFTHFTE